MNSAFQSPVFDRKQALKPALKQDLQKDLKQALKLALKLVSSHLKLSITVLDLI